MYVFIDTATLLGLMLFLGIIYRTYRKKLSTKPFSLLMSPLSSLLSFPAVLLLNMLSFTFPLLAFALSSSRFLLPLLFAFRSVFPPIFPFCVLPQFSFCCLIIYERVAINLPTYKLLLYHLNSISHLGQYSRLIPLKFYS